MKLTKLEISQSPGEREPLWARSGYVADDGTLFLPVAAVDDEKRAMLMASFDGTTIIQERGHLYARSSWLAENYPSHADVIRRIEQKAADLIRRQQLSACPFCGAEGPFDADGDDDAWAVECSSCMASGPLSDNPDEAREAWNRRP